MFDELFPEINRFKGLLNSKDRVEVPITPVNLFSELDMSVGEYELARRFPEDYDKNVNGIKHILVRDEDKEYRYKVVDGEVISDGSF